jgi:hypothetical protein
MRHVLRAASVISVLMLPLVATGQELLMQSTPPPAVTAESEPWFVARAPLLFGGTLYFPAGPQVHFNRDEMVRTGYFGAIPVYTRTTLEPGSVIFVPLSGGLMQPYERRRSGELAGTEGSIPPSFPIENPAERRDDAWRRLGAIGPPTGAATAPASSIVAFTETAPTPSATRALGTTGMVRRHPLATAVRPEGLNGVFVTFDNQRWFSSGEAVPFDAAAFRQVGTQNGLAVYSHPAHPGTIYIPVARDVAGLVAPYSNVRSR